MRTLIIAYDETQTHEESGEPFDLMAWVENEFDNAGFSTVLLDTAVSMYALELAIDAMRACRAADAVQGIGKTEAIARALLAITEAVQALPAD